jgi:predicted O-methyltransferase YrrM
LSTLSRLKYLYLAYFSKPVGDRSLYRLIRRRKVKRILEIGMGPAARSLRMIGLAAREAPGEAIRYVAIDLFEARAAEQPRRSLKETHTLLKPTGAQVQLIPGEAAAALSRAANSLQNMDLVLISADHDDPSLAGAWFYLPRMLHAGSAVVRESRDAQSGATLRTVLAPAEIEARAAVPRRHRAA